MSRKQARIDEMMESSSSSIANVVMESKWEEFFKQFKGKGVDFDTLSGMVKAIEVATRHRSYTTQQTDLCAKPGVQPADAGARY
jgi:hypothetical protein